MKKITITIKFISYFLILSIFSAGSYAKSNAIDTTIKEKIDALAEKKIPNYHFGIIVQDLNSGKIIYSNNANKLFNPASVNKLFSATAAYLALGKDFQFSTTLYIKENNQLLGKNNIDNLYIKFSGDPQLTANKFYFLLNSLKEHNIREIKHNIIIDESIFSGAKFGPGWAWESNQWFYSPPITATMIDKNSIYIKLSGSNYIGEKLTANFYRATDINYKINSSVKSVSYKDSEEKCRIVIDGNQNNDFILKGCWPLNKHSSYLPLSIPNPRLHVKNLILAFLYKENIKFSGEIIFKKINPDNLYKLAEVKSKKIDHLLKYALAESDNVYAETLTKQVGAKLYQTGSFKTGALAIKNILADFMQEDLNKIKIVDGSGLSIYNLISPSMVNKLLIKAYENQNLFKSLTSNMAISGIQGTLKYRFPKDMQGKIKAKTGTMSGISALAGYMETKNNQNLAFTIIVNGFNQKSKKVKAFENEVCKILSNLQEN